MTHCEPVAALPAGHCCDTFYCIVLPHSKPNDLQNVKIMGGTPSEDILLLLDIGSACDQDSGKYNFLQSKHS